MNTGRATVIHNEFEMEGLDVATMSKGSCVLDNDVVRLGAALAVDKSLLLAQDSDCEVDGNEDVNVDVEVNGGVEVDVVVNNDVTVVDVSSQVLSTEIGSQCNVFDSILQEEEKSAPQYMVPEIVEDVSSRVISANPLTAYISRSS